jgi:hypothetical protein
VDALESALLAWFIANRGARDPALGSQLRNATVTGRQFTSGGGAFLELQVLDGGENVARILGLGSYVDGPEIQSPELCVGALATVHISEGMVKSLEIWSYAGDYPTERHPSVFVLAEPKVNHIEQRGEP